MQILSGSAATADRGYIVQSAFTEHSGSDTWPLQIVGVPLQRQRQRRCQPQLVGATWTTGSCSSKRHAVILHPGGFDQPYLSQGVCTATAGTGASEIQECTSGDLNRGCSGRQPDALLTELSRRPCNYDPGLNCRIQILPAEIGNHRAGREPRCA